MVDILQVLEGLAYVGFIAGAIFAVMELRAIRGDRETDFLMRMNDYWSSKDFTEVLTKVRELPETDDPHEIEKACGKQGLYALVGYLEGIAMMAENKLLKKKFVLYIADWSGIWTKLEPWIDYVRRNEGAGFGDSLEWLVAEDVLEIAHLDVSG